MIPGEPDAPEPAAHGFVRALVPQARAALVVLVGGALLGLVAGLAWTRLADHVRIVITGQGPDLMTYETNQFFSGDGMFAVIGLVVGAIVGIVAYLWRRQRGVVVLLGAGLGALVAALVAWQLGRHIGLAGYHRLLHSAHVGSQFDRPVDLRAKATLICWPLASVAVYTALVLLSGGADLPAKGDESLAGPLAPAREQT